MDPVHESGLSGRWWKQHGQSDAKREARREAKREKNLRAQFNGGLRWTWPRLYRRPQLLDPEHLDKVPLQDKTDTDYGGSVHKNDAGKFVYTNQFGQRSAKYSDVAVYLSPTNFVPKRLIVQSTETVHRDDLGSGDWRRCKIKGDVPVVLSISEWALSPFRHDAWYRKLDGCLRVLIVAMPVQIITSIPFTNSWDDENTVGHYTDFPGYHWQWAKHAINYLDKKPQSASVESHRDRTGDRIPSTLQRLRRPRQMVIQQPDQTWRVQAGTNDPYIFISFANREYGEDDDGKARIKRLSERAALEAGCKAYWLDFLCRAPEKGDLLDSDIYHMCDVIRGSTRVVVMLPDDSDDSRWRWGSRMWTLPEALLAPGHRCFFRFPEGPDAPVGKVLTLVEMSKHVWRDEEEEDGDDGPTRLLAEHYSNLLTLSRVELFSLALEALRTREFTPFTKSDIAYALMGLLRCRIERDKTGTDTTFQSLAQLSLCNDTDRFVERMISLYPQFETDPVVSSRNPFFALASTDQFHTRLWDIDPTCQIVGVAHEDNTVLVDSCRAMHIRWKAFPRPVVKHDTGFPRMLAMIAVAVAMWWLLQGMTLAVYYAPFLALGDHTQRYVLKWIIGGFLIVAVALSCLVPSAVRRLYGGKVLRSTSNLVGFEGVMPIRQLERLVFGQDNGRLTYEASSTPYAEHHRNARVRIGEEPLWVRNERPFPELPRGHRLFTLVDMGELSVNIFSAERPPTVALLCGREGGMLRAVLCSWQFENDCLYKEAVLRMPSNVWDGASPKGWLKLCLKTMNQAREDERAMLQDRAKEEQKLRSKNKALSKEHEQDEKGHESSQDL